METEPLRRRLIALLDAWETGAIDEAQVRDAAEELERDWAGWSVLEGVPSDAEPADLSAMAEILTSLSDLDVRWVTRADIPAMRASLEAIDQDSIAARDSWSAYADGVDWQARERELRGNPFYAVRSR